MHTSVDVQLRKLAVEAQLADDIPFGSYSFISEQIFDVLTAMLHCVSKSSDHAGNLARVLGNLDQSARRVVSKDAALRRTVEDGVCSFHLHLETVDLGLFNEILRAAADAATTGGETLLGANACCLPLSATGNYGSVWLANTSGSPAADRFEGEVSKRLPGFKIYEPTDACIDSLLEGVIVAEKIAPSLTRSALAHNSIVLMGGFEGEGQRFDSATVPGLPGVILLNPSVCSSVVDAAQALVHESMHLKFLDIDYIRPLFAPGFRPGQSPLITPIWHLEKPGFGDWPVDRVLTSMHVYIAMSVFLRSACNYFGRDASESEKFELEAELSLERATWLFSCLQSYLTELSLSGRRFVHWTGKILDYLNDTTGQTRG